MVSLCSGVCRPWWGLGWRTDGVAVFRGLSSVVGACVAHRWCRCVPGFVVRGGGLGGAPGAPRAHRGRGALRGFDRTEGRKSSRFVTLSVVLVRVCETAGVRGVGGEGRGGWAPPGRGQRTP